MKFPISKNIDDKTFDIYPLPPREALRVLTRLIKLVGEPLGLVTDSLTKGDGPKGAASLSSLMSRDLPPDTWSKAAKALVSRLDENEVEETIMVLLSKVQGRFPGDLGTRRLNIEIDFAGQTFLMLKVVVASLEVNFGDFFQGNLGEVISMSRGSKGMNQSAETLNG